MEHYRIRELILSSIVIITAFITAGCGEFLAKSTWCDREVIIDGIDDGEEWNDARYFFEKEKVTVGLINDKTDMYVRLSTNDHKIQRQFLMLGFTLWFNPQGGKRKTLGIHFPVGMQGGGMPGGDMQMTPRKTGSDREAEDAQLQKMIEESQKEIEIIGPGKDEKIKMSVEEVEEYGIEVRIGYSSKENLVYELKVPLLRNVSRPYYIGTEIAKVVGIGLESGKMDTRQMGKRGGGTGGRDGGGMGGMGGGRGGGRGGMGGRGGGMGGGRGGMGGGMRRQTTKPIEIWLKSELAQEHVDL